LFLDPSDWLLAHRKIPYLHREVSTCLEIKDYYPIGTLNGNAYSSLAIYSFSSGYYGITNLNVSLIIDFKKFKHVGLYTK
jgi:hypothetical protein